MNKYYCFNPYSPGFSIYLTAGFYQVFIHDSFNPYSPGFSIYLKGLITCSKEQKERFNPYSPGFSIYLIKDKVKGAK